LVSGSCSLLEESDDIASLEDVAVLPSVEGCGVQPAATKSVASRRMARVFIE
jgi:hypothetical protein